MVRPIVHSNPAIHDRKPRQASVVHGFNYTFLHGGDKVSRNGSTDNFILKVESLPARKRREFQPAIAVLAMPAGLLLIFSLRLCRAADRFAIRNFRHVQHHFSTVLTAQFFERKIDVPLAHPA